MKYITDFRVRDMVNMPVKDIREKYSDADKKRIMEYFRRFSASLFTSAPVIDVFTGEQVDDANNGYSDGEYTWYQSEIYHFEHYNMKLQSDFIEHVLKAS